MSVPVTLALEGQGTDPAGATPQGTGAPTGKGTPGDTPRKFTDDEAAALLKENMAFKKANKALTDKQAADENDKLKEQGKFKELAESATAKAQRAERVAVLAKLEAIATREGLTDLDLLKLIDTSSVMIDDDGAVVGAVEAIASFKAAKPAFFADPGAPAHVPGTARPGSLPNGSIKVWADYIKLPEADRKVWASKNPEAFRAIAKTATAGK